MTQPKKLESADTTGFFDVVKAGFDSTNANFSTMSSSRMLNIARQNNRAKYKEITGQDFNAEAFPEFAEVRDRLSLADPTVPVDALMVEDTIFNRLKLEDSNKYKDLKGELELREQARENAKLSQSEFEFASSRASRFDSIAGGFTGALGSAFVDPVNLATLPFGVGASRSLLKASLQSAGINAGAELATQPAIAEWQNELGNDYGFTDVLENVGIAAVMGGSFEAVVRGARPAASWLYEKASKNPDIKTSEANALQYMAKDAHVRESNPNVEAPQKVVKEHNESLQATQNAMKEGRYVDELPMSNKKFLDQDATVKSTDTAIQKTNKENVANFQKKSATPITRTPVELETDTANLLGIEQRQAVKVQQELLERELTPERQVELRNEFNELAEQNQKKLVTFEGEQITIGNLAKRFDDEDKAFEEIITCGIS